jgi:hypothetical protein
MRSGGSAAAIPHNKDLALFQTRLVQEADYLINQVERQLFQRFFSWAMYSMRNSFEKILQSLTLIKTNVRRKEGVSIAPVVEDHFAAILLEAERQLIPTGSARRAQHLASHAAYTT